MLPEGPKLGISEVVFIGCVDYAVKDTQDKSHVLQVPALPPEAIDQDRRHLLRRKYIHPILADIHFVQYLKAHLILVYTLQSLEGLLN